jgi:hypothetical protein
MHFGHIDRTETRNSENMKPIANITFLWPHVSTKAADGVISTKTSGYEGDCHWTGERQFAPSDEFYEVWDWVYRNRHVFPPVFNDDLLVAVNAYYESDKSRRYRHGIQISREPHHLFVHAYWSADSVWADQKLQDHELLPKEVLKIDPLPRNETWGFLMPFCHGYGEYFIFEDHRCQFYAPLGKERAAFDGYAAMIRQHDGERTKRSSE